MHLIAAAIAAKGDIEGERLGENTKWAAFPVCTPCHVDPKHRTQPLKAHFFARQDLDKALGRAGSANIGG